MRSIGDGCIRRDLGQLICFIAKIGYNGNPDSSLFKQSVVQTVCI